MTGHRDDPTSPRLALVTGATGYVGGLVTARLLTDGWQVRVLSRSRQGASEQPWGEQVEIVEGDAADRDVLDEAMEGVDVAWYLLHSMGEGDDFLEREVAMARTFGAAAAAAGVRRIVYLGGLHPDGELSEHLASRVAVGQALIDSGVPTAALQAGVVLGDESSSFAMLRHLSERLPAAVAPAWLRNTIQPIAAPDAVHYLVAAADLAPDVSRTFDIGGPESISYGDMMIRYARALGLGPRLIATAPVTTPSAAAHWIGLVTPVSAELAAPLVGSLLHDTVVTERDLDALVGPPPGGLTGFDDAVRTAAAGADPWRFAKTLGLTTAAVACCAVIGSAATQPGARWYTTLRKPVWQPPGWAFPLAWSVLYADIAAVTALSLSDLAEQGRTDERRAYVAALAGNLALNAGWSVLFFGRHHLRASTLEAIALAASSADLVRRSAAVSPEKGAVLAPYAGWTAFAAALTARIAHLNRKAAR